ncbi:hypothetical protein JCM19233_7387 [Vibrio astriarenae]|nr:hypothetical protein JCM19233_7387 [Vibrio sp. C7]
MPLIVNETIVKKKIGRPILNQLEEIKEDDIKVLLCQQLNDRIRMQ